MCPMRCRWNRTSSLNSIPAAKSCRQEFYSRSRSAGAIRKNEKAPGNRGLFVAAASCSERRSGSGDLRFDALLCEIVAQFTLLEHFADDVATAYELALHIELRNGRPLGEVLDALTDLVIVKHVDALEGHAKIGQHLHHGIGEAALWKDRCAFHEEDNVFAGNFASDAVKNRVLAHCFAPWSQRAVFEGR